MGGIRGEPFTFLSEIGYDPMLGSWVETWRGEDGGVLRPLAQGHDSGDGCVVSVRHEDGRPVRDELRLDGDRIVRRVWRTSPDGVEYLSLELSATRVE